jgi:uncharacterized protein involved in exopolysaccharide biosynthesis/Mrp family chromosome partitioning ATPase
MHKSDSNASKSAFGLQDILFVLFKHKWKVLVCGSLGLAAAAAVYVTRKPYYQSQANLLINYVLQRGAVDDHEAEMATGGRSGDQVMTTEIEILRSGDLAADVAKAVGVERLLGAPDSGPSALADAAAGILTSLEVKTSGKGSNVVYVSYRNNDPQLAVEVLREVVKRYFSKHLEIHRSVGAFDSIAQQADEVRSRLRQTEAELGKLKAESGILSVHDESVSLAAQRDMTKQGLVMTEAELAAQTSRVLDMEKQLGGGGASEGAAEAPEKPADAAVAAARPSPADIESYNELSERLKLLQAQDFELSAKFREDNAQVVRIRREIGETKARKQALLEKVPGLLAEAAVTVAGTEGVTPMQLLEQERAKLRELEAKLKVYREHLAAQELRVTQLSQAGLKIAELERRKEMEDAEYRLLESNLKKAKVDRTLDPSQMPNIRVVQEPSAPVKTFSETTKKIILGLAGAGFAIGIGLAFLIELVLDRRIKRPAEIESRLQLPLMLSIPYVRPKNRGALLIANERNGDGAGEGKGGHLPAVRESNGFKALPGRTDHFIHPYSEAIRDRIVFNFQVNNMTHKPKMMAVTGLSAGAGTSTIAAGLAKAFSEINGAKVLLVDLNSKYPDDNPMFGNKPLHSLVSALQAARNTRFKEGSQNLYLASAAARATDPNTTAFGPMHLYEMLPHFRASEFDYVIFDMPPMAQTSPTLAMAGLMDKVLLVVDGEDTSRDTLKWGYSELVKGRADVSCVFNKARSHAPRWIGGDV